jgi:SAM-dependent methyltransferase
MVAADDHVAVARLRSWAANALAPHSGDSVIDVGCGPGTAAIEFAERVGPTGRVCGVDVSEIMVSEASRRAAAYGNVAFEVGDATNLRYDAASFDCYRSERTYQWLERPERALEEGLRVLRPGGRAVVIDTDWGTLAVDHPDDALSERYHARKRPIPPNSWSGRRLLNQFRRAGLTDLQVTAETIIATSWDPAITGGIGGLPPFAREAEGLAHFEIFNGEEASQWLADLVAAGVEDRFFLALTVFAVAGTKPAQQPT